MTRPAVSRSNGQDVRLRFFGPREMLVLMRAEPDRILMMFSIDANGFRTPHRTTILFLGAYEYKR
jgi:hypothetical protein